MNDTPTILIVEDEGITAASLSEYVEDAGYEVIGICSRAERAWDSIQQLNPDLVFLDINLKGEKNGIWLGKMIRKESDRPFIFLTSYSDKTTVDSAIETEPNGYLVKPFSKTQIFTSISVALNNYSKADQSEPSAEDDNHFLNDAFFIRDQSRYIKINIKDLLFLQAEQNYVTVFTEGKRFVIRNSLKALLEQINHPDIVMSARSYAVNLQKISSIGPKYLEIDDKQIPLSKSLKEELLNKVNLLSGRT